MHFYSISVGKAARKILALQSVGLQNYYILSAFYTAWKRDSAIITLCNKLTMQIIVTSIDDVRNGQLLGRNASKDQSLKYQEIKRWPPTLRKHRGA